MMAVFFAHTDERKAIKLLIIDWPLISWSQGYWVRSLIWFHFLIFCRNRKSNSFSVQSGRDWRWWHHHTSTRPLASQHSEKSFHSASGHYPEYIRTSSETGESDSTCIYWELCRLMISSCHLIDSVKESTHKLLLCSYWLKQGSQTRGPGGGLPMLMWRNIMQFDLWSYFFC